MQRIRLLTFPIPTFPPPTPDQTPTSNFESTSRISLYAAFLLMQLQPLSEHGLKAGEDAALGGSQREGRKLDGESK